MPNDEQLREVLPNGQIELKGEFLLGSNYTFLVNVHHEGETLPAVYKPTRGEQPLWDFEDNTLALREVAAYLVSEALGFCFVPFTSLRADGPFGLGSLQQYIEFDPNHHYFNFTDEEKPSSNPSSSLTCSAITPTAKAVTFSSTRCTNSGPSTTDCVSMRRINCGQSSGISPDNRSPNSLVTLSPPDPRLARPARALSQPGRGDQPPVPRGDVAVEAASSPSARGPSCLSISTFVRAG